MITKCLVCGWDVEVHTTKLAHEYMTLHAHGVYRKPTDKFHSALGSVDYCAGSDKPVGWRAGETMTAKERLFIGVYPTGLVYADRDQRVHNDYKLLGYLGYRTLELELEPDCPPDLAELIIQNAVDMQAKRGQFYNTSTSGQGVILGE